MSFRKSDLYFRPRRAFGNFFCFYTRRVKYYRRENTFRPRRIFLITTVPQPVVLFVNVPYTRYVLVRGVLASIQVRAGRRSINSPTFFSFLSEIRFEFVCRLRHTRAVFDNYACRHGGIITNTAGRVARLTIYVFIHDARAGGGGDL